VIVLLSTQREAAKLTGLKLVCKASAWEFRSFPSCEIFSQRDTKRQQHSKAGVQTRCTEEVLTFTALVKPGRPFEITRLQARVLCWLTYRTKCKCASRQGFFQPRTRKSTIYLSRFCNFNETTKTSCTISSKGSVHGVTCQRTVYSSKNTVVEVVPLYLPTVPSLDLPHFSEENNRLCWKCSMVFYSNKVNSKGIY
jgi:hypothetical protein